MRITTLDLHEKKICGIDVPLRRLAASPEPLKAASWQKLLELVSHLQTSGSEHELWGDISLKTLTMHRPEPHDPVREFQIKRFMDEWHALHPDQPSQGNQFHRDLLQRFPPTPKIHVSVWIDWRDYAPLRDGLPEMHYRFQVKRPGKNLTEDARTKDPFEAERLILEAFGW